MSNSEPTAKTKPSVIEALRRFMPAFLRPKPVLSPVQHRAVWAITHCRTPTMGGSVHSCDDCDKHHFAYHSCNNKACPQCGRAATMKWVEREQAKRVSAPYFMVTFTLPSELRDLFFGTEAKAAYDAFFAAASTALKEKLADPKYLGAATNGFSMVLHTWNQKMLFHPHIHCIVPGGGLDAQDRYVQVRKEDYLICVATLSASFRYHFGQMMKSKGWKCDPCVWSKDWGVHVQPFGNGDNAIKYVGRYISRSVIGDSRIVSISDTQVTFRYKDRGTGKAKDRPKQAQERILTLDGTEFARRYLRHVQPDKLRAVRYYGFCHAAAKEKRAKIKEQSEQQNEQQNGGQSNPAAANLIPQARQETATAAAVAVDALEAKQGAMLHPESTAIATPTAKEKGYPCPCCSKPMQWKFNMPRAWSVGAKPGSGKRKLQSIGPSGPSPPT